MTARHAADSPGSSVTSKDLTRDCMGQAQQSARQITMRSTAKASLITAHLLRVVPQVHMAVVQARKDPAGRPDRVRQCASVGALPNSMAKRSRAAYQGSVGWISTPFTLSDRWVNCFCSRQSAHIETPPCKALDKRAASRWVAYLDVEPQRLHRCKPKTKLS